MADQFFAPYLNEETQMVNPGTRTGHLRDDASAAFGRVQAVVGGVPTIVAVDEGWSPDDVNSTLHVTVSGIEIDLPETVVNGRTYLIKDASGDAENNPITIVPVQVLVTPAVDATGSLTALETAALADGDVFTVGDGTDTITFEFDVTGTHDPVGQNVEIDISGVTTAIEVADLMRTAIGGNLNINCDDPGTALIHLTCGVDGAIGNVAITETLAGGTLTPVGMSGGADAVYRGYIDGETQYQLTVNYEAIHIYGYNGNWYLF